MENRNATVAVIGAGDYIGAAIAKRFAAEGFTVFAGRRHGEKLAPLVADVEAWGGQIVARSLDARKEDDLTACLQEADRRALAKFVLTFIVAIGGVIVTAVGHIGTGRIDEFDDLGARR